MTEQFNYCHVVGQTDVGKKRAANEDNMGNAITINGLVSVVCDGMGGHVGGATASKIAVNTILDNLNTKYYDDPRIAIGESIDIANKAILSEANAHPELSGMGSTCVLLIVRNGKVYIGHVGDSRIYLIRSKKIVQLTKDHSYVQMLVDRGEITTEQAEHHPRKNEITNALGIPNMTTATVATDPIIPEAGDCFLLCSDGLSGMVSKDAICKIVSRQSEMNAQDRVNCLVALANENGGVDNITAQMVEFPVGPGDVKPDKKIPTWLKLLISSLLVVALGLGAYMLFKEKTQENSHPKGGAAALDTTTDIRDIRIDESVDFSKNGEFVTLEFSENSVIIKRKGEQIYREENVQLDPSTLTVEPECIKRSYIRNKCTLEFTDERPESQEISISIKSVNKTKIQIYKYIININSSIDGIEFPRRNTRKKSSSGGGTPEMELTKPDTLRLDLDYSELKKETILLFNYSAKPTLTFRLNEKNKEVKVDSIISIDEVKSDSVKYDKTMWEKKFNSEHHQLRFRFIKDTISSGRIFSFIIPCVLKDDTTKEIILKVQLSPKADISDKQSQAQTKTVSLAYSELEKGDTLLFTYSASAKPTFRLNDNESEVDAISIDKVKFDSVEYDTTMWNFSSVQNQLQFIFKKEEISSDSISSFRIPCVLTDTTTVILSVLISHHE